MRKNILALEAAVLTCRCTENNEVYFAKLVAGRGFEPLTFGL